MVINSDFFWEGGGWWQVDKRGTLHKLKLRRQLDDVAEIKGKSATDHKHNIKPAYIAINSRRNNLHQP